MQSLLFETCFWVHCKVDTQRYLMTPTQSPPDAWLATWHRLNVGWFTLSAAGGTSTPSSQPQTQKQLPDTTKFTIFLSFFPLFDRYTGASTTSLRHHLPVLARQNLPFSANNNKKKAKQRPHHSKKKTKREKTWQLGSSV